MKRNVILLALVCTGFALSLYAEENKTEINQHNKITADEIALAPDTTEETEEKDFPLTFGFDLVSRYIWRGVDFGMTPAFQPGLDYNVGNDVVSFDLGAWASYSITGTFAEMDLYTTLTFPYAWVGLTDYFFPVETAANDKYFYYKKGTAHVYEVTAGVSGPDKVPISAWVALNLNDAGSDPAHDHSTLYFEVSYSLSLKRDVGMDIFVGGANGSYYVQKDRNDDGIGDFNIVNTGISFSKTFSLGKKDNLQLPLSLALIANPDAQKLYLTATIGLWNQ